MAHPNPVFARSGTVLPLRETIRPTNEEARHERRRRLQTALGFAAGWRGAGAAAHAS